jgi:phosphatidylglycerophosphate synthase
MYEQRSDALAGRRPLATRGRAWARALAAALARRGVRPNAISACSVLCALLAAACLVAWPQLTAWQAVAALLAAAAGIQLRLLCNMLDGMVAIEGGLRSPTGDLWNEVPDRVADSLILVAAGYGVAALPGGVALGWAAALLAMLTAYVRALGASLGQPGCFHGPMAKPHRMALLTAAAILAAIVLPWQIADHLLWLALALIAAGSAITAWRRLAAITRFLKTRQP